MSTAELKGKVSLNSTSFHRGLRNLRRTARRFSSQIGRPLAEAGARLARIGMIAGTAVAAGMSIAIKKAADYGDEIDKASKRTGIQYGCG